MYIGIGIGTLILIIVLIALHTTRAPSQTNILGPALLVGPRPQPKA
jgi:hypothetical protein